MKIFIILDLVIVDHPFDHWQQFCAVISGFLYVRNVMWTEPFYYRTEDRRTEHERG